MRDNGFRNIAGELLDGCFFRHVAPCGLTVYVYEMPGKSSVSAQLAVGFGSADTFVRGPGGITVLPAGTAHFLEHKMFERDGEDAFSLFSAEGASSNAYTTFNRTTFVFRSGNEWQTPLRTLLDFFTAPRFTEDGIEKEKEIIADEIRMYLDDPGWRASFGLFRNLYASIAINQDIAGSETSIRGINRDLLASCFYSFYRPENMCLTVCGNVRHGEVFSIADSFSPEMESAPVFSRAPAGEPDTIVRDCSSDEMTVSMPLFSFGYKESAFGMFSDVRKELLLDMVLDLICGESTEFYRNLYDDNLINESFSSGFYSGDEYLCTYFEGDSFDPFGLTDRLTGRIATVKQHGFSEELFDERARTSLGSYISLFDSPGSVAGALTSCHFKKASLYDIIQFIDGVRVPEADSLVRDLFDPSHSSISVINPISGDHI